MSSVHLIQEEAIINIVTLQQNTQSLSKPYQ